VLRSSFTRPEFQITKKGRRWYSPSQIQEKWSTLKVYEEISKDLRGCTVDKNPLSISVTHLFKPVKAVTIEH